MKKYRFSVLLLSLMLIYISLMPASNVASLERPYNILIINAYHYTYPWTFDQNVGINSVISEAYPDAVVYTEFLDWKRFPDMDLMDNKRATFSHKYKDTPIDLIITTDDMGLTFALEHRQALFSNAPIAFSGIIEFTAKEIIGNHSNVTGVYEQMDPRGALELVHTLQPDVTKLYIVHDLSESGVRTGDNLKMAVERYASIKKYEVVDLSEAPFNELQDKVRFLEKTSALFMVSYNISVDGQKDKPEVFGDILSKAASVPVYTIDEFLIDHSILGGTVLSGVLQGEAVADLGVTILEGTPADMIPHDIHATVYSFVDEDVLIRFNLSKNVLSPDIQIINPHPSFYEDNKLEVQITLTVITLLLIFIAILSFNIQKRRLSEREVIGKNMELQALYEQIQASEEELLAQNEELESYQVQLVHDARYDALTALPNRYYLSQYGNELLSNCEKSNHKLILFFIDLDNFRYINNTHGHFFGDTLLKAIATRLDAIDNIQFAVRFGGDEFVTLATLDPESSSTEIESLCHNLRNCFLQPFEVNDSSVNITSSIGYSIYPDDGRHIDELVLQADMAMYETKKDHVTYALHYKEGMRETYEDTFALISNMKTAFEKNEFTVYYQPQIELATGKVIGFEALLRWFSKDFGIVSPAKFIPLAESSGFITTLGDFVLENALDFVKDIRSYMDHDYKVSINVSVLQMLENDFLDKMIAKIREANISTDFFQIEVTESVFIQSYDLIIERLNEIRKIGVSISLDDFGTGYSSLSHLQQLPITELKIDKVFVDHILTKNTHELELIDAIMTMAKTSNLCVVAEGVEEEAQINYLKDKECDIIQGYYYSKPLPAEDVKIYCKNREV